MHHPAHSLARPGPRVRPRRGYSLLELVIALSVLTLGPLAIGSTLWRSRALVSSSDEQRIAQQELRALSEEVRAFSHSARISADPRRSWSATVVDAFAPGGAIGNRFDVPGLHPVQGAASVGTIRVLTDETATNEAVGFDLALPRDLDGDGLANATDVRESATLLPVVIDLRWRGEHGERRLTHGFYLIRI